MDRKARRQARARIEEAKITKAIEETQCGNKIQHEDFWSAMMHCSSLCRDMGILYTIYHCNTCGFAHVGHAENDTITWMYEGIAETFQTKLR
jgi:hypothetical protein